MIEHLHNIPTEFLWLFGSLVVLLGVASGIGALLLAPAGGREEGREPRATWSRASMPGG